MPMLIPIIPKAVVLSVPDDPYPEFEPRLEEIQERVDQAVLSTVISVFGKGDDWQLQPEAKGNYTQVTLSRTKK